MSSLTKITDKQLAGWKIPRKEIEPCIVERGEGFIRVDGGSECWKKIVATRILPKPAKKPKAASGPGTEIEKMFILILTDQKCSTCALRAAQMNAWGVKGCREHRAQIIDWLTKAAKERGWLATLSAGINAAKHGLPLTIGGLVDEAIRRAEMKESAANNGA